jgi:hypothetical protein
MLKVHAQPSTRRQNIIHPSEMAKTNWCPKSTYLRIKACREADDPYLKVPESIGVQLLNIFDEGHYIHAKWQNRLNDMGLLWGNWACYECNYVLKDRLEYDDRCPSCKSRNGYIYREVPLRLEQYLIYGHADGAVPTKDALIEIKSVGVGTARIEAPDIYAANSEGQSVNLQGLWKDIKEPFPSHVRQGQLYLYLAREMGLPFKKMIFLYESKFNQGAKEFVVDFDYEIVWPMLKNAIQITNALEGLLPNGEDCIVCKEKNLPYPFICECTDEPVKCPYGGCKDCESYGAQKSSDTNRVEHTTAGSGREGVDSTSQTLRRPSGVTTRLVRPS